MLKLYLAAAPLRLRHYAEAGGRTMLRQWQGMLIFGLLVVGQATTILMLPAAVLTGLAEAPTGAGIAVLLIAAMLYVLPQRTAIRGGEMSGYAETLPISLPLRLMLDATVLLLVDALFLLELMLAVAIGGVAALPGLVGLLLLVLAAQLAMLHAPLPNPRRTVRMLPLPALLRTNVQALAERPVTNGGRYLVVLGVAAAGAGIATAFHFDGRALPVAIGALALSGFVLADFYRLLRETHAPIRAFLATLPVSPRTLVLRDLLTVLCLGVVPYLMLAVWFGAFDPGSLAAFVLLAFAYAGLLAALRWPLLLVEHLAAILAALIAAGWAGSAIAMVLK